MRGLASQDTRAHLIKLYRTVYERVVQITSNLVARCGKYGVRIAIEMLDDPTIDGIASQLNIFALLLEKLDQAGVVHNEDVMMPPRARGYADIVARIADAFERQDEEEVKRLISELNRGSLL